MGKELEARDQAKAALEKARNNLEGYISESREKLDQEEVQALSTEAERETIAKLLTEVYDWFDEDGWDADEPTLKKKLKSLKEAIKAMLQSLNLSTMFSTAMLAVPDSKDIYSEKDIKDLEKVITDTKTWFYTTWKKQNETAAEKNPVMLTKEVYTHQAKLDREVAYLINKAKYHVPKPKPKPAANSTTTDKKTNTTKTEDKKEKPSTDEKETTKPKAEKEPTKKPESTDEKVEPLETPEVVKENEKPQTEEEKVEKDSSTEDKGKDSKEPKSDDTVKTDKNEL